MRNYALTALAENTPLESIEPTFYSVIHWVEGRIRLRIPQIFTDSSYAIRLERSLNACPVVTKVCINVLARSITVSYCVEQMPANQLQEFLVNTLQKAKLSSPTSCSTRELAERLGVSIQALNWWRSQADFTQWSQLKDPQALG